MLERPLLPPRLCAPPSGFFPLSRPLRRTRLAAPLVFLFASGLGIGCASRPAPRFEPAGLAEAGRALAAWQTAIERSEALPSAKLLYDARLAQGLIRVPGTLAVAERPGFLEATLAGPFGTPLARYEDGALRGEGIKPLSAEPEDLRSILAGVWRMGTPAVAGWKDGDALLVWEEPMRTEGVLDVAGARLRSLRILRPDGELFAAYSGAFDPWPQRIELTDVGSGNRMRLTLIAKEPLPE